MTINPYSIPAILALILKLGILYAARRAGVRNRQSRLFELAVLFSMVMNLVEITIFHYATPATIETGIRIYYGAALLVISLLTHLAITITFDNAEGRRRARSFGFYGVPLTLIAVVFFTPWIVAGFQPFRGYTYIRVPGPLYWLFEGYIVLGCLTFALLPLFGIRAGRSPRECDQCKLWMLTATPPALLIISVMILLHLKMWIYSATVTLPLLLTLHLAAIGYAVHSRRVIEVDYYIPLTRKRRTKLAFYKRLLELFDERSPPTGMHAVLQRLRETFGAPVCLLTPDGPRCVGAEGTSPLARFPVSALTPITQLATIDDLRVSDPAIVELMRRHDTAAVVPLLPSGDTVAQWIVIGEPFGSKVYSPLDFRFARKMFDRLTAAVGRLPEYAPATASPAKDIGDPQRRETADQAPTTHAVMRSTDEYRPVSDDPGAEWTLEQRLQQIERNILEDTLRQCRGNQAEAARRLGLRPNTLYYKLQRYGMLKKGEEP
ncbi:MAG TPA: helix-turn-helix domain-containing protein [Acidiferrobacterales bacterium]